MNMKRSRGSLLVKLIQLLGVVALTHAFGPGPRHNPTTRPVGEGVNKVMPSRAEFISTMGTMACLLVSTPANAKTSSPSESLQAGFDSLNREVSNLDRVVSKEAKKIDRAVSKKTNKVAKEVRKDLKKVDRVVTKEAKKIDRVVTKKTTVAKREAKKIGTEVEKKSKALLGGVLPPETAGQKAPPSKGGIDVSRVKLCTDVGKKCL